MQTEIASYSLRVKTLQESIMKEFIAGGFALLLLCVGSVHAQQASQLQLGTPVTATLPADGSLRYELDLPNRHFVAGRVDQDGVDATVTITARQASRCPRPRASGEAVPRRLRSRPTRRAGT